VICAQYAQCKNNPREKKYTRKKKCARKTENVTAGFLYNLCEVTNWRLQSIRHLTKAAAGFAPLGNTFVLPLHPVAITM